MKPPAKNTVTYAIVAALIIVWVARRAHAVADDNASFTDNFGV